MIDVTVVIPTTGTRSALLRRALASVQAQTIAPAEVLIVVDGGDEALAHVRATLGGLPAVLLAIGTQRGASVARNHGAIAARATHLAFLDDDDAWKPGYLARVFTEGPDFDLALTAFEKHTRDGARPEKVPPEELTEAAFLVANPGLRGSNLVVARELFRAVGGFSEEFPSFNDLDFGLRLIARLPFRYRRIPEPLVEYHAHDGERLSRRGASTIGPGLECFVQRHGPRMAHGQEAAFRDRALALWGEDPWALERLEQRLKRATREGTLTAHFPGLLHAAETTLLEASCRSDEEVDRWQAFVDRLCGALEQEREPPPGPLRMVVLTTDTPGTVASFLSSLRAELDRSGWRSRAALPLVEVLFVRNDRDTAIAEEHDQTLARHDDPRVRLLVEEVPHEQRPLSPARARARAFAAALEWGWLPSPGGPLWSLDEDFRFEVLLPSVTRVFRAHPGGSLLHRAEYLARCGGSEGIDALVGGNSGAAPVPALGLLRRQLADLARAGTEETEAWGTTARRMLASRDAYYDLSTSPEDEPFVARLNAWWRAEGAWDWNEVAERLLGGLPVTRPALPRLWQGPTSAWGPLEPARVAGGNTLLLSARVLRPELFAELRASNLVSRRGDTIWALRCQKLGARVVEAGLPLLHARQPRTGGVPASAAVRMAQADAFGVGLYATLCAEGELDAEASLSHAQARLTTLLRGLREAQVSLLQPSSLPGLTRTQIRAYLAHVLAHLHLPESPILQEFSAPGTQAYNQPGG